MQDEKSQIQNRAKAMQVLRSRLLQARAGPAGGRAVRRPQGPGRRRRALREDPHLQLQGEPGHRPPHRAHALQARQGAGRRARRRQSTRSSPTSRPAGSPRTTAERRRPTAPSRGAQLLAEASSGCAAAGLDDARRRGPPDRRGGVRARAAPSSSLGARRAGHRARRRALRRRWSPGALAGEPLQYVLGRWGFRTLDLLRRPPGADPAARDRGGRRGRPSPSSTALAGAAGGHVVGRPRHRVGRHRPVARRRARPRRRGVGHRRVRRRARRGPGQPRRPRRGRPPGRGWSRAPGSRRCPTSCAGAVDLVVSNPPYVARRRAAAARGAPTGSRPSALVPGPTGLEAIEAHRGAAPRLAGAGRRRSSSRSARPKATAVADARRRRRASSTRRGRTPTSPARPRPRRPPLTT